MNNYNVSETIKGRNHVDQLNSVNGDAYQFQLPRPGVWHLAAFDYKILEARSKRIYIPHLVYLISVTPKKIIQMTQTCSLTRRSPFGCSFFLKMAMKDKCSFRDFRKGRSRPL